MRKLIVAEFVTLDGFISRVDGQMDFFLQFPNETDMMINAQKDWDLLLFGKNTYDALVHFWPNNKDKKDTIATYMNTVPKIVVSSTLKSAPWGDYKEVSILSKNISEEINKLKQQEGKSIAVLGSAMTTQYLLEQGLVDEYSLLVYPIILGAGKSLFSSANSQKRFQLIENKTLGEGVIQLKYKVPKK